MTFSDEINQALEAGEVNARIAAMAAPADRTAALLFRFNAVLSATDMPEPLRIALVMQAGEMAWHAELCHGQFCDGE